MRYERHVSLKFCCPRLNQADASNGRDDHDMIEGEEEETVPMTVTKRVSPFKDYTTFV